MTEERIDIGVKHPNRCPYCHDEVRPDQPKIACEGCMAWHHRECWESHQSACSACGRSEVETEAAASSAALADRAARITGAIEEAKASVPLQRTSDLGPQCILGRCSRPRFGFGQFCARHRVKDGKVLALVGGVNVVFWGGLVGLLGAGPKDDILGVALIIGGLGALMGIYGAAILVAAARQQEDPAP